MVSEEPTRKMVKQLETAGWRRTRTTGSHSWWTCPTGVHGVSLPDGHKTISAGVVRQVAKALAGCDCAREDTQR